MISRDSLTNAFPITPLGDVVEFLDNMRKPIKESDRTPGPYPYYGANGEQGKIDRYIFDEPLVLLAEDGGFFDTPERGIAYRINGKTWVNNHAHVLRPKPVLDLAFLCRVLENYNVMPYISGSTRAKLTKGQAEQIEIPLPPLDEQRRIAAILDQADTLRHKRREALQQLSQLGHAIFNQMFPFGNMKRKPLTDMIEIQSGLVDPKKDEYADLPHIGPEHIQKGTGELLPFRTAREDAVTSGKFLFDETCVLYSKIRPNLNKVALAVGMGLCSADMYAVRPKEMQSTREYIWFLLRTADFLVHASGFSNRANIPKLNKEQVLSYLAPAPTFDEMLEFSKRINTLQKLRNLAQDHLNQLEGSFASLQHRAFRGEL